MSGLHKGTRQHLWGRGSCIRCGMRAHWPGAKDGCSGPMLEEEHRERVRRYDANKREKMKRAHAAPTAEPVTETERTSR